MTNDPAPAATTATPPRRSVPRIALWIALIIAVAFWAFVVAARVPAIQPAALWGIAAAVSLILLAVAGHEINGQWFGILIDTRNKLSLARLQITLWTIMVLSAFLTMAMIRVRSTLDPGSKLTHKEALDIKFPPELLLAMGISAASFAGATLIKSSKTTRQVTIETRTTPESAQKRQREAQSALSDAETKLSSRVQEQATKKQAFDAAVAAVTAAPDDAARLAANKERDKTQQILEAVNLNVTNATKDRDVAKKALDDADAELKTITEAQGLLHKNTDPSEARWVDLFRGEEIGNYKLVDMSKVQMLFFTIGVVTAYAAAIAVLLRSPTLGTATVLEFPDFNDTLNGLLGISHGTYLSVKAVNHS